MSHSNIGSRYKPGECGHGWHEDSQSQRAQKWTHRHEPVLRSCQEIQKSIGLHYGYLSIHLWCFRLPNCVRI